MNKYGFWEILLYILVFVVVLFSVSAIPGFILMLILHGFGIKVGFWTCFGIFFLISVVAQLFKNN